MTADADLTAALTDDDALFGRPDSYLLRFEEQDAIFAGMNRAAYRRSIFLDSPRIRPAAEQLQRIAWTELQSRFQARRPTAGPVNYIFHMAHCGSTLVSRALDRERGMLVCREPEALRQLGALFCAQFFGTAVPAEWQLRLRVVATLLGRRYAPDDAVVVKANVPVNAMLPALLDTQPENRALFLYLPLAEYLLAVLRSDMHCEWVRRISSRLHRPIDLITGTTAAQRRTFPVARDAACIWVTQTALFREALDRYADARSVNAEQLFQEPAVVLDAVVRFFDLPIATSELREIVNGELFTRHAKFPDRKFDNSDRIAAREALRGRIAADLHSAQMWVAEHFDAGVVPECFGRPLLGSGAPLLSTGGR